MSAAGGYARAARLSPERRREIAVLAARRRWSSKPRLTVAEYGWLENVRIAGLRYGKGITVFSDLYDGGLWEGEALPLVRKGWLIKVPAETPHDRGLLGDRWHVLLTPWAMRMLWP